MLTVFNDRVVHLCLILVLGTSFGIIFIKQLRISNSEQLSVCARPSGVFKRKAEVKGVTYQRLQLAALGNSRGVHHPPFILGHLPCMYVDRQEETEAGSPPSPVFSHEGFVLNTSGQ